MFTHSMTTIYLSLSAQVAISTFFTKSPVALAHTLIALAHLNSTEKLHRLYQLSSDVPKQYCIISLTKKHYFFLKMKKKCLECSETKAYAKVICEVLAWVSIKTIFPNISKYFSFFSFKIIHFKSFLFQKTYIFIHVKTFFTYTLKQENS